jgi:hypothetical protein
MKTTRLAATALSILMAVVCVPGRAAASDAADVMAVINNAVASFNKGDGKTWEALCTSPASIVSNIAPYQYYGPTACADWWSAHAAASKKAGVSDEVATLGKAWHIEITGGRAYASIPAGFSYKQKGKMIKTTGNVLTIALHKTATGWLMTGWSWSQR